eukprot:6518391-Prymnesium_polylepis.1
MPTGGGRTRVYSTDFTVHGTPSNTMGTGAPRPAAGTQGGRWRTACACSTPPSHWERLRCGVTEERAEGSHKSRCRGATARRLGRCCPIQPPDGALGRKHASGRRESPKSARTPVVSLPFPAGQMA